MSIADKLATIAENEQKVYDAGKKAEYDAFWDTFQMNGTRTNYCYGFRNWEAGMWNAHNFKPKYDINIAGYAPGVFVGVKGIKDFTALGVSINTSQATNLQDMFYNTDCEKVGVLDLSACTAAGDMFSNVPTKWIEKIICSETTDLTKTLLYARSLEHVIFEGVIAKNGLNVQNSPLDHESLMSIINVLKSGASNTVTLGSANLAKLTDAEKAIATQKGWTLA